MHVLFKSKHKSKGGKSKEESHQLTVEDHFLIDYINYTLRGDSDLSNILPLDVNTNIFDKFKSGILLCKIVNALFPGSISHEDIELKPDLNTFDSISNINFAIKGAKDAGCKLVNIKADDIILSKPEPIIKFLRTVILNGLLKKVSLQYHTELLALIDENEDITSFMKIDPEKILLRWFNYHLERAGQSKIENFGSDLNDGIKLLVLLEQISPPGFVPKILHEEQNTRRRAQLICEIASVLDVRKFISVDTILDGNEKLNLMFIAYLFDKYPGLGTNDKETSSNENQRLRMNEALKADLEYKELLNKHKLLIQKQNEEKAASGTNKTAPACPNLSQANPQSLENVYPSSRPTQTSYSSPHPISYNAPQQSIGYSPPMQSTFQQPMGHLQYQYQQPQPMISSQIPPQSDRNINSNTYLQQGQQIQQPNCTYNTSYSMSPPPLPPKPSIIQINQQDHTKLVSTTQYSLPLPSEGQRYVITKTTTTIKKK